MQGILVELFTRSKLDKPAEIHDGGAVAHVPDHAQIMGDKDIGKPEFLLKILEEVEHLGLDGDVQRGNWLVAYDQLGPQGERLGR